MNDSDRWQSANHSEADSGDPDSTSSGDPDSTSSGDPDKRGAPDRRKPRIVVRATRRQDVAAIERLSRKVYPTDPWPYEDLLSQHDSFPEGQLAAVDADTGEIVGMAASLLIRWADYQQGDSYGRMTAGGSFQNHDPSGDTLYGAEVMVDPTRRRQGIGAKLYEARRELARRFGVRRILAGARLPGYRDYAHQMTAQEYVRRIVSGELADPTLSFQLRQGFRVLGVVPRYARGDQQSHGYAALIEWSNDEHVRSIEDGRQRRPSQRLQPAESSVRTRRPARAS